MALLIKTTGVREPITEPLTLGTMQRLVDGYIELVTIRRFAGGREVLIVDEEGLLKGKPKNRVASMLIRRPLVGDVILCMVRNEGQDSEVFE